MDFGPYYDYLILDMRVERIPSDHEVIRWLRGFLPGLGVKVLGTAVTEFRSPVPGTHAYTLTAVLSASHMAVHTAPEHSWVHIVFALCGDPDVMDAISSRCVEFFAPEVLKTRQHRFGITEDRE